jgi:hypothetical protein
VGDGFGLAGAAVGASIDSHPALEADSHAAERASRFAGYGGSTSQLTGDSHGGGDSNAMGYVHLSTVDSERDAVGVGRQKG